MGKLRGRLRRWFIDKTKVSISLIECISGTIKNLTLVVNTKIGLKNVTTSDCNFVYVGMF